VGLCVATKRASEIRDYSEIRDDLLVLRARHLRAIFKTQRTQMNARLANTRAIGHRSSLSRIVASLPPLLVDAGGAGLISALASSVVLLERACSRVRAAALAAASTAPL
jgi:hypothetical protein